MSEPGMPEGITRIGGECRKGCGQTLEMNEYGTVECCLCGAKRQGQAVATSMYTIAFSQATTMATVLAPSVEAGGTVYYLKAKARNRKSAQHIGYARVVSGKEIVVTTVNGVIVGTATSRAQATQMIDAYHRANNAAGYWMWINDTLLVRGEAVTTTVSES